MQPDAVLACVGQLQQAGWQVSPVASPWQTVTEMHAHRWWSGQLVDAAHLSLTTGQGMLQRIQVTATATGPAHIILADSGLVALEQLPAIAASWPAPPAEDLAPSTPPGSTEPPSPEQEPNPASREPSE
ncbi:hypothetical protein [Salinifilum aidingensis]